MNKRMLMLFSGHRRTNYIGVQGGIGFGVGVYPGSLPSGFSEYSGTKTLGDDNYGNYQYSDGSQMTWNPFGWYRIGHVDNPTYALYDVNSISIVPENTFASVAAANAAGYAAHRAFYDGGVLKRGFFYDKYFCSNNNGVPSSIKNGNPISTAADHNPISGLTGSPANAFYSAIIASKLRGANFHCVSKFQRAWITLVSLAHAQASTSTTYNAWYDATGVNNFPKGCNNNALGDENDATVHWQSDGYLNCGKTGSCGYGGGAGNVFAKSTHNGQNCGIADVNGLMWELNIGITCVVASFNISGITKANPAIVTTAAHGKTIGQTYYVQIQSVTGMTEVNDRIFTATITDATHFSINVDSSAFTTYSSAGSAFFGDFYVAKTATSMKDFTSGTTLATDHWGATGIAAMMDSFTPVFRTDYPKNGFVQRYGSGSNQVLASNISGTNYILTGLGFPYQSTSVDTTGTNLFGKDYYYQYIVNQLFMRSVGAWSAGSAAGCSAVHWHDARAYSNNSVSFRLAMY